MEDPNPTIDENINAIKNTIGLILDICKEPIGREDIGAGIIEAYDVKLNIPQYYLTMSTVAAFLSYMSNEGLLQNDFINNKLVFFRK